MALDEHVRQSAESFASDLGRDVQQRLEHFFDTALRDAAQAHADELTRVREQAAADASDAVQRAREEAASEATAAVARARDEVAQASAQLAADHEARQAELARLADAERVALDRQREEREAMLGEMERLVEAFRRLDGSTSLSALLDALAAAAADEASRTALWLVRGRELHGWAFSGSADAPAEPRRVGIALDARPDLARAVDGRSRVAVAHDASASVCTPAPGHVGVAVPVTVGGSVAALLYADDGEADDAVVPGSWPEALEMLARHAARCIEAQTAMRAAGLVPGSPAGGGRVADTQEDKLRGVLVP